jgi:hypothetical protein
MKNSLIFTARIFRNTSFPIVSRPYFNQTREMSKDTVADSIAATKVEYKRLGSSGLRVSVPIFGCMSFGSSKWAPWVIEEDEVCRPYDTISDIVLISKIGTSPAQVRLRQRLEQLGYW